MIQAIVESVIEFIPRVIGRAFLKLVTLGRYRGFRDDDLLIEGALGLGLIAGLCFLGYRFWPRQPHDQTLARSTCSGRLSPNRPV